MKKLQCKMCGWVYDEAKGIPDEGIIPGTAWADIPETGLVQFVVLERKTLKW